MTKVFQCPWPTSPLQPTSMLGKQSPGISRFSLTFVFEPEAKPQLSDVFTDLICNHFRVYRDDQPEDSLKHRRGC